MRTNGSHPQLTAIIAIHDKAGNQVGEKEVAAYSGVLALAHEDGLRSISTKLVQIPNKENGMVAIATAKVRTNKGTFEGIGDADPSNVNSKIVRHLIRMSETRAKARALRDAVNIGLVTLEELGDMIDDELSAQQPATRPNSRPQPSRQANDNGTAAPPSNSGIPNASEAQFKKMSEAQRGLLFRLAGERGVAPPEQESWILQQLGAQSLTSVSRFSWCPENAKESSEYLAAAAGGFDDEETFEIGADANIRLAIDWNSEHLDIAWKVMGLSPPATLVFAFYDAQTNGFLGSSPFKADIFLDKDDLGPGKEGRRLTTAALGFSPLVAWSLQAIVLQ